MSKNELCPVWQKLMHQVAAKQLTNLEETAKLLGNLNYQVQNGGWSQWVGNGYAQNGNANRLKQILVAMAGPCAINVRGWLETICKYVDLNVGDRGCMGDYLKQHSESYEQSFQEVCEPLDTEYYAQNDAFMAECETYLAALAAKDNLQIAR